MLTYNTLSTHTKVAIASALSTLALAMNGRRIYASIQNNGGVSMWLGMGVAAVVGEGFEVAPGGYYEWDMATNPFVGPLYAIMASGDPVDQPIQEAQI